MEEVTRKDVKNYYDELRRTPRRGKNRQGEIVFLAHKTAMKRLQFASVMYNWFIDEEIIKSNPFMRPGITDETPLEIGDDGALITERKPFITRNVFLEVFNALPNEEWRTIAVLSRFSAFRCPTEVSQLTWRNINWKDNTMIVVSPKTAYKRAHIQRTMPMFDEVAEQLERQKKVSKGKFVISDSLRLKMFDVVDHYGKQKLTFKNSVIAEEFKRYINNAGYVAWPSPFHSMRASRMTDLLDESVPIHKISKWCGASEKVIRAHYTLHHGDDVMLAEKVKSAPLMSD